MRLEHRRHQAGEAQQDDDREHDLRELDGLVDQLVGEAEEPSNGMTHGAVTMAISVTSPSPR